MKGYRSRPGRPEADRDIQRKSRLGVTRDTAERLLAEQGGVCPICLRPVTLADAVDHDHATGAARGLLHKPCNTALGMLGDDASAADRAADYLRRHR
jgi:hypothetical protein